jgi:hypothetical protein
MNVIYHSRPKTSNTDGSIIFDLVNDIDTDQYEAGESDEIVEDFEYSPSRIKRTSSSFHLSEDISPVDVFHLFYNNEIFELIQRGSKVYGE